MATAQGGLACHVAEEVAAILARLACDKTHNAEAILFDYRALGDRFGNASLAARSVHAGMMPPCAASP